MKCPECGRELAKDQVYCEHCGKEIQMVPDFEPEAEFIPHGMGEQNQTASDQRAIQQEKSKKKVSSVFKVRAFLIGILCLVLLLGIFLLVKNSLHNNGNYQMKMAEKCLSKGVFEKAEAYYIRAMELQPGDNELYFQLAKVYQESGNWEEYENILLKLIHIPALDALTRDRGYEALIPYYESEKRYSEIESILQKTKNTDLLQKYEDYLASPPEFSHKEGTYLDVLPLKLTSRQKGMIYYSCDGSIPDENSESYKSPLFLEPGEYVISAVFVNEYGLKSPVVTNKYEVELPVPQRPEINLYSGSFTEPEEIVVTVPDDCEVYYTINGKDPTQNDILYVGKIPLALGENQYRFAACNKEGVFGETAIRNYSLTFEMALTPEKAVNSLLNYLVLHGKIKDLEGTPVSPEQTGKFLYHYSYPQKIQDQGIYFIITEYLQNELGEEKPTGKIFAVNVGDARLYRLSQDIYDQYLLEELTD